MKSVYLMAVSVLLFGWQIAFSKDLHIDCSTPYDLRFAGTEKNLVTLMPGAGRSGDALRLVCPTTCASALFHGADRIVVENVASSLRVTAWVKGEAHGEVGILCYDENKRNLYGDVPVVRYSVTAAENWKKVVATVVPRASGDYCNRSSYLLPYVTCSSGESVLVDDVSVEFLSVSEGPVVGAKPAIPLVPSKSSSNETPSVPIVTEAPPMVGAFLPSDWQSFARLGRFADMKNPSCQASEQTVVFLCRDEKMLYVALVMEDVNVDNLARRREADFVKEAWRLPGMECAFGREGAVLHLAFDCFGRFYSNRDIRLYVSPDYSATRVVVRFALPLALLPRHAESGLVTGMNFYRKSASGVSSWRPNVTGVFADGKALASVNLASADAVAADRRVQETIRTEQMAHLGRLREQYGPIASLLPMPDWTRVEPLWRPAKIFGRDYWNSVVTMEGTFDRFREAGIAEDPFIREALIWLWWPNRTEQLLEPDGWAQEALRDHPNSAVSVKTIDRAYIREWERGQHDIRAFWDKDYAEKFLSIYDAVPGRFVGFWEDEAFVADSGHFAEWLRFYDLPMPKNRDEAYQAFGRFYNMRFDKMPKLVPFRNLANASPYFHAYACNSAAATFNHFTSALGDRMSGNETGDCMGPNQPKFAIARGAARQWGRPWRNYQTYYQFGCIESKRSGGFRCQYDSPNLLKPDCRYYQYDFCNGPDIGLDEARQKNTFLYPYFCGCGVYSSEANHEEMLQWYDRDEIMTADPMCVALRDPKGKYISELARINRHFYSEIVKKRDRGVTLTPFGVIFDRANGYAPLYFGNAVWDFFAPTDMEQTMWAFCSHVFKPYGPNSYYTTGKFGDVFDIFTNDATEEFLRTYPVLMPIGDVTLDVAFANRLKAAVEAGSTLVINAALVLKYPKAFDAAFLGAEIGEEPAKAVGCYSRLSGRIVFEDSSFGYRPLILRPNAVALAVTADEKEAPVMALSTVGKGRVILTAPDNMKPTGSTDTMLRLFDDLVTALRYGTLPIRVTPDRNVAYAIARNATSFLVYLNNNNGVPAESGVYSVPPKTDVSRRAGAKIAIPFSLGKVVRAFDWWTGETVPIAVECIGDESWSTTTLMLPGGDCAVVEFVVGQ